MKSDSEIFQIASQICDHYCKYPDTYDEDAEGTPMAESICIKCPLNKLLEE